MDEVRDVEHAIEILNDEVEACMQQAAQNMDEGNYTAEGQNELRTRARAMQYAISVLREIPQPAPPQDTKRLADATERLADIFDNWQRHGVDVNTSR